MPISPSHVKSAVLAARSWAQSSGNNSLPVDLKCIARQLGIVRIEPRTMDADGYLGQTDKGELVIRYRHGASAERTRFTIAHEIGHMLLAKAQGRDLSDPAFRLSGGDSPEEIAVNRIAAELLMPEPLIRGALRARSPSWIEIWALRRIFWVSTTALLRRILELSDLPAIFFRIDCSRAAGALHYRCQSSERPRIFFENPIELEVRRILAAANCGRPSEARVYYSGVSIVIQMANRLMPFYGKRECWSFGWRAAE
jgi:Zn-dependent peptidase ImmA (M78 family)